MFRKGNQHSEAANLFISLLVRYPVITRISYRGNKQIVSFHFVVRDMVADSVSSSFINHWTEICNTLHYLENVDAKYVRFDVEHQENITIFSMHRDLTTLTFSELSLSSRAMWGTFRDRLVIDKLKGTDISREAQEQLLTHMLVAAQQRIPPRDMHVFRDGGKVIVTDI